jgi:hypothetical protein
MTDPDEISEGEFLNALKTLGYDKDLFSTKSRCYVCSVHSESPIDIQIGDALTADFWQRGRDLLSDAQLVEEGEGD